MTTSQKFKLGNIVDTFTMMDTRRTIILDRDCSVLIKYGEKVLVEASTGVIVSAILFDGYTEDARNYQNIPADIEKVSVINVDNSGFPKDVSFQKGTVYKA